MKIAINGDIINTKDIYKISEFYNSNWRVYFIIEFFNNKALTIEISKSFHDPITKEEASKVIKLRENIIKIWSENQSEIPQFNLE